MHHVDATDDATAVSTVPASDESGDQAGPHTGRGRSRRSWAQKSRRERGVVLVWFALLLVVLLGFAGFAVDMSNWWFQAERLQRAADAGAHAGVVFLPADLPGATTTARAEAAKNGYTASGAGANSTIAASRSAGPKSGQ